MPASAANCENYPHETVNAVFAKEMACFTGSFVSLGKNIVLFYLLKIITIEFYCGKWLAPSKVHCARQTRACCVLAEMHGWSKWPGPYCMLQLGLHLNRCKLSWHPLDGH